MLSSSHFLQFNMTSLFVITKLRKTFKYLIHESNSYSRYLRSNTFIILHDTFQCYLSAIFLLYYIIIISINYIEKLYHENTHFIIHQRITVELMYSFSQLVPSNSVHCIHVYQHVHAHTRTCIHVWLAERRVASPFSQPPEVSMNARDGILINSLSVG